tara:strand:+ start:381 stop:644 length:264 start_codon:yes stop_codon:yes gene_type:complete
MKMSDKKPPQGCQNCNSDDLVKIMSQTHFVLKGQGWYETDFKDKKPEQKKKTQETKNEAKTDKKNNQSNNSSSPKKSTSSPENKKAV